MKLLFLNLFLMFASFGCVNSVIDWAAAIGAAATAASAVTSGASMLQGLAGAPEYSVVCTVEIENWTKYPLLYPSAEIHYGQIKSPPIAVRPGQREMFIAHKTGHTATGTSGTASWLISSQKKRAVVMWSCPYNFDHFTNWLGVGLTVTGSEAHQNWFNQMYYQKNGSGLNFVREQYYDRVRTISINDGTFEVTGTIGTSHKAKAHIIVRPLLEGDIADAIKAKMVTDGTVVG